MTSPSFNYVRCAQDIVDSLVKQGWRQCIADEGYVCLYRHKDESGQRMACAIGGILPDEIVMRPYDDSRSRGLRNTTIVSANPAVDSLPDFALDYLAEKYGAVNDAALAFLSAAQAAHDAASDGQGIREHIKSAFSRYDLRLEDNDRVSKMYPSTSCRR